MMPLNPFVWLISTVIELYGYVVMAWLILSWLIAFKVVNQYQPAVRKINYALFKLTDPALRRIRKFMPDLGGIDISPVVLIIILHFLDQMVIYYSTLFYYTAVH